MRRCFRLPVAPLLERTRTLQLPGGAVPVLDPEDALIHTALHAAIAGGDRLVWLADLDALVRTGIRWDVLIERARGARLPLVTGVMLERASLTLDTPLPGGVLEALLRSGRLWGMILVWFDRARPVAASHGRLFRGQVLVRSTRHSTLSSVAALFEMTRTEVIGQLIKNPDHPWRQAWTRRLRSRQR